MISLKLAAKKISNSTCPLPQLPGAASVAYFNIRHLLRLESKTNCNAELDMLPAASLTAEHFSAVAKIINLN